MVDQRINKYDVNKQMNGGKKSKRERSKHISTN